MRVTSFYPVVQTPDIAGAAEFFVRLFGLRPAFASDWYVHLTSGDGVDLAVLAPEHETIPAIGRGAARGVILTFEVEDADAEHARLRAAGVEIVKPIVSEDFGQRHFMLRGPGDVLIDVITPIPPSAAFAPGYAEDALPTAG